MLAHYAQADLVPQPGRLSANWGSVGPSQGLTYVS